MSPPIESAAHPDDADAAQSDGCVRHPEWSRAAAIYQLNTRQFTAAGTLRAARRELPRLRSLEADIVWLMPIHPIGGECRKGRLGSPYSVRDYYAVDPELGTLDDLRGFVAAAHGLGMRVLLDWVANHTARDNPLVTERPEWYARDWKGALRPAPWLDWDDTVDLDYGNPALRRYMLEAMRYWVRETDIDGYRCDAAAFVPTAFWTAARRELEAIKPVFMLAEAESRELHAEAFDASYAWSWHDAMQRIAAGQSDVGALRKYYARNANAWPRHAMRMTFVSNHDKNAWDGTEFELFGEALGAAIVLSAVGEGIPLIYNGQEAGNDRRLAFFEKDRIAWRTHPHGELYRRLFSLKKRHKALWNGCWGGAMIPVPNDAPRAVLSFVRASSGDTVFAVFNLSEEARNVGFTDELCRGRYTDCFRDEAIDFDADTVLALAPWDYRVFAGF